jgi:hypothetical protein
MADIMCGVVNDVDMRKADHTNNEQTETHREDSLKDDVEVLGGNRQVSGVGLLHVKLLRARHQS